MKKQELIVELKELPRWKTKISKRLRKVRKQWFDLTPQHQAIEQGICERLADLTPPHRQVYPRPVFHGRQPFNPIPAQVTAEWAPITLMRHHQTQVLGGCNFLLHGRAAVHPDLYLPSRDRSPFEMYGRAKMGPGFERIRLPMGLPLGRMSRGITLCDQTPYNYAHWQTEIVPKLAFLGDQPEFSDWPLIVDSGLGNNQMEIIRTLMPQVREVVRLAPYERLTVDELISVSPTSYCPHEFRDFYQAQKDGFQFFFSERALDHLRQKLRLAYAKYAKGRPRKLYLKRTPLWTYNNRNIENIENIENIDEIEDVLDGIGIEMLNVTGMTMAQQAKMFMNAELIVAPTGAALTNMLFAPPGCRILVLAAAYDGATYDYFHHLAYSLGHDLSFVIGPQTDDDVYHMNRDYVIDTGDLELALNRIMSPREERILRTVAI